MIARAPCPSRPLLLLSTKRRAALRDTLTACVGSWRSQWSAAHEPLDIAVPQDCEHASERGMFTIRLSFASQTHGELGDVRADADVLPSLLAIGASAETGGAAHGVTREFLVEMLRSLCRALAQRAQVDDVLIEPARVSSEAKARAGYLAVALRTGHGKPRVVVSLTARAVELLAPPSNVQRTSAPLTRRRLAVTAERVQLEAVLGNADVALRDLVNLTVGDVIVLDQPLDRGGHLALPDGRVVAQVVVGRAGERRAISIAAQSEQGSEHS